MRHGATTLFAALNVFNGAVLAECKLFHRHQELLAFLQMIDESVLGEFDIHRIVDNYVTHSHPKVRAWLAAKPRWNMHFISTYSSWLNQIERFFGLITNQAIRRSVLLGQGFDQQDRSLCDYLQADMQALRMDCHN